MNFQQIQRHQVNEKNDQEDLLEDTSSSDDESEEESWIEWHLQEAGNEFLCEVDRRFIEDNFNLTGLREVIQPFKQCLDLILDRAEVSDEYAEQIEREAQKLYGLIHARFILTKRGQDRMYKKFQDAEFGVCPLPSCELQAVLPVGLHDFVLPSSQPLPVHVFCPRCEQVMLPARHCADPKSATTLDGAYIGTTFPHLFLMQFEDEIRLKPPLNIPKYVPKVFGFRVRKRRNLDDEFDESQDSKMEDVDEYGNRRDRFGGHLINNSDKLGSFGNNDDNGMTESIDTKVGSGLTKNESTDKDVVASQVIHNQLNESNNSSSKNSVMLANFKVGYHDHRHPDNNQE